jgi:hypothetical protein
MLARKEKVVLVVQLKELFGMCFHIYVCVCVKNISGACAKTQELDFYWVQIKHDKP